ncbi:MAG: DUF927 domain-containing protein [Oscillospiraceae bacterium]|nr:DUF927 domain-containing protein [Oscillospiraceae bacterium]
MNARLLQAEQQAVEEKFPKVKLPKTMGGASAETSPYVVGSSFKTDLPGNADILKASSLLVNIAANTNRTETQTAPGSADSTSSEPPQGVTAEDKTCAEVSPPMQTAPGSADSTSSESPQGVTAEDKTCAEVSQPTPSAPRNADSTAAESPQEDTADETNEQKETDSEPTQDFNMTVHKWWFNVETKVDPIAAKARAEEVMKHVGENSGISLKDNCLMKNGKRESTQLANFAVLSIGILADHSDIKQCETMVVTVYNMATGNAKTVEVHSAELTKGNWISQKLGLKYTCSDYKILRSYLDRLIPSADETVLITESGWHGDIYVRASDFLGDGDLLVKTPGFEPVTTATSADEEEKEKGKAVLGTVLACARKTVVMKMMFFTLIISMLTSLFIRGSFQRIPQYVLALIGVTGTGKTAIVKALLSFLKDYTYFDLSVGYTGASLRKELARYRDTILFVDDLVDNNDADAIENVNMITRMFGNAGSSHKTFNSEATAYCRAIVTGEVEPILKKSSLNRMVFVHVTRDDIDFDKISELNKHETKEQYAKAVGDLLLEITQRGPDKVAKEIYDSFLDFDSRLNETHEGLCQRRVEAYSWILAAERFYREYLGDAEYVNPDELFDYAVENLRNDYAQFMHEMPEYIFCQTIVENTGKFQKKDEYKRLDGENWGYYSSEFLLHRR